MRRRSETGGRGRRTNAGWLASMLAAASLTVAVVHAQSASSACTFVVDPAGVGTHTAIQVAIDALPLVGPCRIDVKAGTYHESLVLSGTNGFAAGENARIEIIGSRGAVLAAGGERGITIREARFLTIEGLTIAGAGRDAVVLDGGPGASTDITLARNDIHNNGSGPRGGGVRVGAANAGVWIVNNAIRSNGRNGITVDDRAAAYIVNNTLFGNAWNGVSIGRAAEVHLVNNLIVGNGIDGGTAGGRWGVSRDRDAGPAPPALVTLRRNVLYGNGPRAARSAGGDVADPALLIADGAEGNLTTTGREGAGVAGCATPQCTGLPASAFFDGTGAGVLHLAAGARALKRGLASFVHRGRDWIPQVDLDGTARDRAAGVDVWSHQSPYR